MRRAFLMLLLTFPLLAQSGIWGSRGISRQFAIKGTRLYAAEGRGVAVYDISNPAAPKRLETATRDDETLDVAVMSDTRIVSITTAGIDEWSVAADGRMTLIATRELRDLSVVAANGTTIAVASPLRIYFFDASLANAGSLEISARVNAILFRGEMLYAAIDGAGVAAIDPSDPADPHFTAEQAKDLALAGNTLWLAGGATGLTAIDAESMRVISRTDAGEVNFTRVAAAGTRVYAIDNNLTIRQYDATNPASPRLLASFAGTPRALAATASNLFTDGGTSPLRVYSNDKIVATFDARSVPLSGVAISPNGSLAYVVDAPYLRVIDISNSAAPREIGSLQIDGIEDRIHINADGTRAVLYNRGDVQLVDIHNPYAPKFLGVWHSFGRTPSRAAFLGGNVIEANWMTGFHILDFDHYSEPVVIGSLKFDYWDLEARPDSDVAYVNSEVSVIAAMNASDTSHPFVSHMVNAYMTEGAFADENDQHAALLVARTPLDVRILDLTDRFAPENVTSVPIKADAIAGSGQTIYLATSGFITLMDVSNSGSPSITPSTLHVTAPQQMAAVGEKLVIADTYWLRVVGPNTPPVPLPQPSRRRPSRP